MIACHSEIADALGYPMSDRTRFRVRIEVSDGEISIPLPFWAGPVWAEFLMTLEAAQVAYVRLRRLSGLNVTQFGPGEVFDESGQHIATITFGGHVWPPMPWLPGSAPVARPPEDGPLFMQPIAMRVGP